MKTIEQHVRSFIRTAYLISDVAEIEEALADREQNHPEDNYAIAALKEMLEECRAGGVDNFGDLPL